MPKKYFLLSFSLGIALSINLYFRFFPVNFPQLKAYAQKIIAQGIYQEESSKIDQQFPGIDFLTRDKLIKAEAAEYKKTHKQQIHKQVQDEHVKLKDRYQGSSGQTYLMELDCWHWARYVENVLRFGRPGDKVVGGYQFDTLMLAPDGFYLGQSHLLFYFSAFLYKIFSFFKAVSLFTFLFYLPLFFIALLTPLTKRTEIILVYRSPGPITIKSESSILFIALELAFP